MSFLFFSVSENRITKLYRDGILPMKDPGGIGNVNVFKPNNHWYVPRVWQRLLNFLTGKTRKSTNRIYIHFDFFVKRLSVFKPIGCISFM